MTDVVTHEIEGYSRNFFHSSIESACRYIDAEIEALCSDGLKRGWKDRVLAGMLLQAFLNESFLNAVGFQVFEEWASIRSAEERLKLIRKRLLPEIEANKRPYLSVNNLRNLRNKLAHHLPEFNEETVIRYPTDSIDQTEEKAEEMFNRMGHAIGKEVTLQAYRIYRDDSASFRKLVQNASGLDAWDLLTHRVESETVIWKSGV